MATPEQLESAVAHLLERCQAVQHALGAPAASRTVEQAAKRLQHLAEELREWEPIFGSPLEVIEAQVTKIGCLVGPLLEAAASVEGVRVVLAPPRDDAHTGVKIKKLEAGWLTAAEDGSSVRVLDRPELSRVPRTEGGVATDDLELWREVVAGVSEFRQLALVIQAELPTPKASR